ncbi:MAG: TonB family protein [Geobacteraceae bacterium]|nr:TonB family protein [Geobacteraceae bacterium]
MPKYSPKATLVYAGLGTLALNLVLFVLLPELVRDPEIKVGLDYTEPLRVQVAQQRPNTSRQSQRDENTETQTKPQTQPAPSFAHIPALEQMPAYDPLLPKLEAETGLPTPEFTPAGAGEVYTMDVGTDIAAAPQVYASDDLDQPVRPIAQTPFMYPLRAKRQGIEGWVKVALQVGMNGEVEAVEILEANPDGVFEKSVTRGIRSWRFSPATVLGERVRARVVTTIRFELED